jgi:8-oxo-dGTP pyrophosphatase MutT (NUDIX family)
MTPPIYNPQWLQALRAGAIIPPLRPRVPLWAGESVIGSVEPDFLHQIALQPLADAHHPLLKEEHPERLGWRLMGDVTTSLNQIAVALHEAGLAGAWRDEQLAVPDQFGHRKGTVERAAVRPLGITTLAVHLVGQSPDGRFWVQQRAFNKSNDPGLWDTLMGGMVSAADTVETALARETWEEAGLHVAELHGMRYGGRLTTRRPATDGKGAGYVVEDIDWYVCTVPEGLVPDNQDGEVEQFRLMGAEELLAALQRGEFTTEAALILSDAMELP